MNALYNQFIGMYDDVYPDGFCNHMISEFERIESEGHCGNRQDEQDIFQKAIDLQCQCIYLFYVILLSLCRGLLH